MIQTKITRDKRKQENTNHNWGKNHRNRDENITSEIKILLDGISNRLETVQVKMSEFEDHNRNYPISSIERKNTGKKFTEPQ